MDRIRNPDKNNANNNVEKRKFRCILRRPLPNSSTAAPLNLLWGESNLSLFHGSLLCYTITKLSRAALKIKDTTLNNVFVWRSVNLEKPHVATNGSLRNSFFKGLSHEN